MEIPIYRAAYRLTGDEVATAVRRHRESMLRPSIVRLVSAFLLLLSALICFVVFYILPRADIRDDRGDGSLWPLAIVPALAVYWIFFRERALAWQVREIFKKQPGADHLIEFEISPKEVKHYQRGLYYNASSWKNFVKVAEAPEGFLFYEHAIIFHWLPFRAFETPEAPERVREFIQASGVPYKKIAS